MIEITIVQRQAEYVDVVRRQSLAGQIVRSGPAEIAARLPYLIQRRQESRRSRC